MLKFLCRYPNRALLCSFSRSFPKSIRTEQTMGSERIAGVIRRILQPLTNERSRREAGRVVRRSDLVNVAGLYRGVDFNIRKNILSLLAKEFGCDSHQVLQHCRTMTEMDEASRDESALLHAEMMLGKVLKPVYHVLLTQLGTLKDGVKLLIDMRYDAICASRNLQLTPKEIQDLKNLSNHIGEILGMWFSVGLLQLSQITWNTPAVILEKLADYEAVHTVRNWMDLKHRLGPNRRCYAFFHGNMPEEPLIVLHVALTQSITDKIADILDYKSKDTTNEKKALCAIFYSITSTQKGLQGIELGAYLIQSVVESLKSELPELKMYSSLSPIPGFRNWLLSEFGRGMNVHKFIDGDDAKSLQKACQLIDHKGGNLSLLHHLVKYLHLINQNTDLSSCIEGPLMKLCAFYLCKVKHRGYALDPVSNFHLKNGAVVWRLNWMADTSKTGMRNSCGIMVNYRYYLEDMANNSANYVSNHTIPISEPVRVLLDSAESASKL